jgi:hypothetical protein
MDELGNFTIPWLFIIGYVVGVISEKFRKYSVEQIKKDARKEDE